MGGGTGDVTFRVICIKAKVTALDNTATPGGDTADFMITDFRRDKSKCMVFENHVPGFKYMPGQCKFLTIEPGDEVTCTVTNMKRTFCHDDHDFGRKWWKSLFWHWWCHHDDD
jgi:hypothetical protein